MGRSTARQVRTAGTTAILVGAVLVVSSCGGDATVSFAEPMAAHATGGDVAFRPDAITATLPSVRYDDGGLTWPVLEAAGSDLAPVTDDAGSLAALRAAAQRAPRTVTVS